MSPSEEEIQQVWEKGMVVEDSYKDEWRKDRCGAWISRKEHGNRDSIYGWEIDHIDPNGGENISNKRPLQWKNNVAKGERRLECPVTADGNKNVERQE